MISNKILIALLGFAIGANAHSEAINKTQIAKYAGFASSGLVLGGILGGILGANIIKGGSNDQKVESDDQHKLNGSNNQKAESDDQHKLNDSSSKHMQGFRDGYYDWDTNEKLIDFAFRRKAKVEGYSLDEFDIMRRLLMNYESNNIISRIFLVKPGADRDNNDVDFGLKKFYNDQKIIKDEIGEYFEEPSKRYPKITYKIYVFDDISQKIKAYPVISETFADIKECFNGKRSFRIEQLYASKDTIKFEVYYTKNHCGFVIRLKYYNGWKRLKIGRKLLSGGYDNKYNSTKFYCDAENLKWVMD